MAHKLSLASQLSQVIRATPQGSLSDAAYTQKLRDAILALLENHTPREANDALAQIDPTQFSNPSAVALALAQVKLARTQKAQAAPMIAPQHAFHGGAALPPKAASEAAPAPLTAPALPEILPSPSPPKNDATATPPEPLPPSQPKSDATAPAQKPQPQSPTQFDVKYNAPDTIPLGMPTDFRLIIASAHAVAAADFAGAPGEVASHQIPKVTQVKAVMSGPKDVVDISSGSAPCQTVGASDNPAWDWAVTPKTAKLLELQVEIWEVGPDCNAAAPVVHRIDSFSIKVTATWLQTLESGLGTTNAFLTALFALVAAGGAAFGAWKWLLPNSKTSS
jgi:hypothetical protein